MRRSFPFGLLRGLTYQTESKSADEIRNTLQEVDEICNTKSALETRLVPVLRSAELTQSEK
jgi:hypothetical protein